jgi:hypothetical protein
VEVQDRKLELISQSIGRQKIIAMAIGDEAEVQLGLLDNMEGRIERTQQEVERGTMQVDRLREKASTCSCWVLIAALALVIVLLVLL